jgi:4-diphosphocytidyl-2-C-methyl-D-erythritol kinase
MAVTALAPAKINLGLEILKKRADGYHEVDMVMQSIDLCDEVEIEISKSGMIEVSSDKEIDCKPEHNIVYRIANTFFEHTGIENPGIRIAIKKNIPISAGLAGGSSDGAATLSALNCMFNAGLSNSQLMDLGSKIGSDIPFCVMGGTAHATGSGVTLKSIGNLKNCFIVVVKPSVSVSTKEAYERSDSITDRHIHSLDMLINGIKSNDLSMVCKNLFNRFEEVISEKVVLSIKKDLCDLGARGALMSGSGPTVFGMFEDERTALSCVDKIKKVYPRSFCCKPLKHGACIKTQW